MIRNCLSLPIGLRFCISRGSCSHPCYLPSPKVGIGCCLSWLPLVCLYAGQLICWLHVAQSGGLLCVCIIIMIWDDTIPESATQQARWALFNDDPIANITVQIAQWKSVLFSDESCLLHSHPSSLPIFFSLFSSSFDHSLSMHSVHLSPYLKLERFSLVDWPQIVSNWGSGDRFCLCSTGTQNSDSLSWPINHPSSMPRGISLYPSRCLTVRSVVSWTMRRRALVISFVPSRRNANWSPWLQNSAYRWPVSTSKRLVVFQQWIAMSRLPRDWWFRAGESAIESTPSGMVMGLPQSWPVRVSHTRMSLSWRE